MIFNGGLFRVNKDGRVGLLDKQGELAIDYQDYGHVNGFQYELNFVSKNNKMGAIDCTGNIVIPIEYDDIEYVDEHYLMLTLDDEYFIANFNADILKRNIRLYYPNVLDDNDRPIYIAILMDEENLQEALFNHELKEIVPFNCYDDIYSLNDKYFKVKSKY